MKWLALRITARLLSANLSLAGFIAGAVSVGIGELIVCYVLGVPADDGAAPHEDQRTHVGVNLFRARPEKVGRSL